MSTSTDTTPDPAVAPSPADPAVPDGERSGWGGNTASLTDVRPLRGSANRPDPADSGVFLAIGSVRIRGFRFTWGDEIPQPEAGDLLDNGYAVRGAKNLRNRDGSRKPHPRLRGAAGQSTQPGGVNDADHDDTGAPPAWFEQLVKSGAITVNDPAAIPTAGGTDDEPDDDEIEVSGRDGVRREGASGDARGATSVTDSQSGNRVATNTAVKGARRTGGK